MGTGGPGYQINEEFNTLQHDRGIVSMARSDHKDSAGSQFFIVLKDSPHLDGEYTAFGRLVPGIPCQTHSIILHPLKQMISDAPLNLLEATIMTAKYLILIPAPTFDTRQKPINIEKEKL